MTWWVPLYDQPYGPPQPLPYSPAPYPAPPQQGWVCPKCGAVMAPFVPTCWHCQPRYVIMTTVTFIGEEE